jgi:hypothetical protein
MRNWFNRALVVAGVVALATAAAGVPAYATNGEADPSARMNALSLDLPVLLPDVSYGPEDNSLYRLGQIGNDFALFEGVNLYTALNVDVASLIDDYASRAFGGLFVSSPAVYSPYLTQTSGGGYAGVKVMLADGLRFSFGRAFTQPGRNPYLTGGSDAFAAFGGSGIPFDGRSTATVMAGLNWNFSKWSGVSLTAAQTSVRNEDMPGKAQTTSLGVSAHVGLGRGWVTTVSYNQASTQLSLNPVTSITGDNILHSQSYGIAVAKHGLFGKDALGLSLSRPATGYNAQNDMQFQFFGRDKLFAGAMPETDIEVGYVTSFLDRSVALDVNASYQMNYNGLDRDGVSFISRAKIKF